MSEKTIPMSLLPIGARARVSLIPEGERRSPRFRGIGLIKGTLIEAVLKGPSGDPTAFLIRGALIALRDEDLLHILVEVV